MDTYLAIASRRDRRDYDGRPVAEETVRKVLDAGRLSGSAKNRQLWRFIVVAERQAQLAELVHAHDNVATAGLVVAIVVPDGIRARFDAGRVSQNMLLAAWNEGVVSCPNGLAEPEKARELLDIGEDERIAIVLSFGYPTRPADPTVHDAETWSEQANRRSLDELVTYL
jgi:nitroreductase